MDGGHVARDGRHYGQSDAIGTGQPGSPSGVDDDYRRLIEICAVTRSKGTRTPRAMRANVPPTSLE